MSVFAGLDASRMTALAARLAPLLQAGDVLCLHGDLGAGKTFLARALLQALGLPAGADVASPTFALVNHYAPPDVRLPVAHADFYRLESPQEVAALGLDDVMDDHLLIVEWAERWGAQAPPEALHLYLRGSGLMRDVEIRGTADWTRRLASLQQETVA